MDRVWKLKSESLQPCAPALRPPTRDPLLTSSVFAAHAMTDSSEHALPPSSQRKLYPVPSPSGAKAQPEEEEDDAALQLLYQAPKVQRPDGGYGWVVVLASLLINFIVEGVAYSFPFYFNIWQVEFNASVSEVSWCGSLLAGFYMIAGPFASALANKHGCRRVTIVGSVLACVALVVASCAQSFTVLIISYGIAGGIGFGLMFLPAVIIVGLYFSKKRALATGFAVCGTGLSGIVFPMLIEPLLEYYKWRGTLLLTAGLVLNGVVLGALFRPLPRPKPQREDYYDPRTEPSHIIRCILAEKRRCATISQHSLDNVIITRDNHIVAADAEELVHPRTLAFVLKLRRAVFSSAAEGNESAASVPNLQPRVRVNPSGSIPASKPHAALQSTLFNSHQLMPRPEVDLRRRAMQNLSMVRLRQEEALNGESLCEQLQRPLNRSDIFLSHVSLSPQATVLVAGGDAVSGDSHTLNAPGRNTLSAGAPTSQVQSVLIVPGVLKPSQLTTAIAGRSTISGGLGELLGGAMLRSLTFLLLSMGGVLAMLGYFIPIMHLFSLVMEITPEDSQSAFKWVFTMFCVSNTVGRILSGLVADRKWGNPLLVNNLCLLFAGCCVIAMPFCASFLALSFVICSFGLCIASFTSLRSIIIVHLFGVERLTNGFGLLLLFHGVASLIGAPLTGKFVDLTEKPGVAYYIAGGLILFSGLLGLPVERLRRWELLHRPGRVAPPEESECKQHNWERADAQVAPGDEQEEGGTAGLLPRSNQSSSLSRDSCYATWEEHERVSVV